MRVSTSVIILGVLAQASCAGTGAPTHRLRIFSLGDNAPSTLTVILPAAGWRSEFREEFSRAWNSGDAQPTEVWLMTGNKRLWSGWLEPGSHLVVVMPRHWVIEDPAYEVSLVSTPLLLPNREMASTHFSSRMAFWSADPVPVCAAAGFSLSPEERTALDEGIRWAADLLNEAWGHERLVPAEARSQACRSRRKMVVRPDRFLYPVLGKTHLDISRCLKDASVVAHTARTPCLVGRIESADIRISKPDDAVVLLHEMMHALGFSHSCTAPSIMGTEFPLEDVEACHALRMAQAATDPLVMRRRWSSYDVIATRLMALVTAAATSDWPASLYWVAH